MRTMKVSPEQARLLAKLMASKGQSNVEQHEVGRLPLRRRKSRPGVRPAPGGLLARRFSQRAQSREGEPTEDSGQTSEETELEGLRIPLLQSKSSIVPPRVVPPPAPSEYGPMTQISPLLRLLVKDGYRAVFFELKPGVMVLLTVRDGEHLSAVSGLGIDPILTTLALQTAASALSNPAVQRELAQGAARAVQQTTHFFQPPEAYPGKPVALLPAGSAQPHPSRVIESSSDVSAHMAGYDQRASSIECCGNCRASRS